MGMPEYVGMDKRFVRTPGIEYMPESPLYPGGPTMQEILNGEPTEDHQVW
jgi:hypothetical protein